MRAYLFYSMLKTISKQLGLNLNKSHNQRVGIVFAILLCLICGSGCNHTPSPEKPQLSDEFYENLLISFTARDYRLVKEGLQKITEAGIDDKRTLYLGAMLALIERDQEKAVLNLKAALAIDPEYAEAHNTLGTIYMQQKQFATAETEFIEASNNALYQTPEKAYHNLGNLYQQQNKKEQAKNCYFKALELNRDYFPSYYELSRLYFDIDKLEFAAQEIEKARQLSPEHPGVWLQIGKIKNAQQKTALAIEAFKQVIKLQPRGSFADQANKELNLLTGSH